jgi:uncharacterized membrane protein YhaH (DUF805 family)
MDAETSRWSFLFRTDEGRIDAPTWRRNAALLVAIFAVLTVIWIFVEPFAAHDLAREPLFSLSVLAANLYRLVYGIAGILLLISYYNLSAKRWRDIGLPAALAGLLPFLVCVVAALHWLATRLVGEIPHFAVVIADIIVFVTLIWNVLELGGLILPHRRPD